MSTIAGLMFALWLVPFEMVFWFCFGIDLYDPKLLDVDGDIYQ